MKIVPTDIDGVVIVDIEPHVDERGHFARTFCAETFVSLGLDARVVQTNMSHNHRAGTLRGLHLQRSPHAEAKLVRCSRGRVFDVAADVRRDSPTRGRWVGVVLDADGHRALYVPPGCAHGYLTLEDDSVVVYQVSAAYVPGAEVGVRWDEPRFGISWPAPIHVISAKDASWPYLSEGAWP